MIDIDSDSLKWLRKDFENSRSPVTRKDKWQPSPPPFPPPTHLQDAIRLVDQVLCSGLLGCPVPLVLTCLGHEAFVSRLDEVQGRVQRLGGMLMRAREAAFARKRTLQGRTETGTRLRGPTTSSMFFHVRI